MERLTYKTENGWVGVHNLEDKNISPTSVAIRKLAEFEDFMEEQGFEDLDDLKKALGKQFEITQKPRHLGREINGVYFTNEQCFILSQFSEFNISYLKKYQALKDRWQKLKKLLEEDMEHNSKEYDESFITAFQHYSATENWVLDKMEELEKE